VRDRSLRLRILLYTRFHPNVGGVETVAAVLVNEWVRAGEEVTVMTGVAAETNACTRFPFRVLHRPNPLQFIRTLRTHDVFLHFNVSLRAIYPLLFARRPWVVGHHGFYTVDRSGSRDWRERLKLRLMRFAAANIAVSGAVAEAVGTKCTVIPNPYDDSLFCRVEPSARSRELAFVGRLVSDKGADILLAALVQLGKQGLHPKLTIIGDGPERTALEQQTNALKLDGQVSFTGSQPQAIVAEELRGHEILVVPSLWEEPFGVVALEGAGCGCVVLGSDGGGLPEAIGPAGLTFRRGDVSDLASTLTQLLRFPEEWGHYRKAAPAHLAKHRPRHIAARYLEVLRNAVNKRR
jgi:glycogen synthase